MSDVTTEFRDLRAYVTIHRPPTNYLDADLVEGIADAYAELDADDRCRVIVLQSEGKHFCAGANVATESGPGRADLFAQATRLFHSSKPVIARVQGAAVGGGLGLALTADFRVASTESIWSTAFAKLGFSPGFGLSVTLPLVVGHQHALRLLYTADRIRGIEAAAIGLCDVVAEPSQLDAEVNRLSRAIEGSAPLAVQTIRRQARSHLAEDFAAAVAREAEDQQLLKQTADFLEGVNAMTSRRTPDFKGR